MTISELDLDVVVTYLHAQNEVSRSNGSKNIIGTDTQKHRHTHRHTDRQTDTIEASTIPPLWAITINSLIS